MNLYKTLQEAIESFDIDRKEKLTQQCLEYCSQNKMVLSKDFSPIIFKTPSYFDVCKIVSPKALKARKDFDTKEGLGNLVHAITHIEYSAIDLALDAVYRFPLMPQAYKIDWLEVALDEVRHYRMLESLLNRIGYGYGDFSVHSGLFDVSQRTTEDVLDRMVIVPRYYEAGGLDVNPQIIKKLNNKRKLPLIKELIDCLNIIYKEEIVHVQKGDRWFKWICKERSLDNNIYFKILEKYKLVGKHRPHLNVLARKEAGFSCAEIKKLADVECH